MSIHYTIRQFRARRQTFWLIVAYLMSYATIVYLTYSLMQALTHISSHETQPHAADHSDDGVRPRWMILYLLGCPFDRSIPAKPQALADIAGVIAVILGASSLAAWWNLRHGGPALARMMGAERIIPKTAGKHDRRMLNIVEEIAIASETRVPRVFVIRQEKGINSFSAARNPDDAILCVTQGLIDQLSRDEQQAVIACEFSHILNGDMQLNMRLSGLHVGTYILLFFTLGTISTLFALFLIPGMFGRLGFHIVIAATQILEKLGVSPDTAMTTITFLFGLSAVYFFHLLYIVAMKLAIARRRIYLADAFAVQWSRNPGPLISALRKIENNQHGSHLLHSRAGSVGHTTFASVFRGRSISQWFDTHPSVKRRIRAIESRKELWPEEPKRQPRPELTQDPIERAARDWTSDGQTRDIPLDLATVSDLLLAIPDEIRQLASDPATVMPLVFALLLDARDDIREKQFAIIERIIGSTSLFDNGSRERNQCHQRNNAVKRPDHPACDPVTALRSVPGCQLQSYDCVSDEPEQTQTIAKKTDPLRKRLRPVLAEITFATLRDLSPEQYAAFRETVNALIRADGKVDLFEYTFNARLLCDLDRHFRRVPEARVQYHSTLAVLEPFVVVLSAVAYAGNRGDGMLMPSYNEGLHIFGHRKPILPSNECTMQVVDAALKKLAESSPAVKRRIMRSLVACVMADDFVTVREREILRAIAAVLHVTLPPMA